VKKIFLATLFFICINLCHSQNLKIVDSSTKAPIPYTSIYMLLNNEVIAGLSGDENGDAILNN